LAHPVYRKTSFTRRISEREEIIYSESSHVSDVVCTAVKMYCRVSLMFDAPIYSWHGHVTWPTTQTWPDPI